MAFGSPPVNPSTSTARTSGGNAKGKDEEAATASARVNRPGSAYPST